MDYSPMTFRILNWYQFTPDGTWKSPVQVSTTQRALCVQAVRGNWRVWNSCREGTQ